MFLLLFCLILQPIIGFSQSENVLSLHKGSPKQKMRDFVFGHVFIEALLAQIRSGSSATDIYRL